ncbi:DUF115 domain-containing protein [Treponema sp. OMZ 840]|uniref:6-hydroxymethylpterin diphosphokinase MptE-like protein n=1 Tax=Treponema sp. OMZ 840 TaxID=244313 RepID=UPI003D8CC41D
MNMQEPSCYTAWIRSKNGIPLPCYADGKPAASVYDPIKEAQNFADLGAFAEAGFILIAGLGSTLHLNALAAKYPNARIAAVEANRASADFILQNPDIRLQKTIRVCTAGEICDFLAENYFPPVDGDFCLFPLRSWTQANPILFENVKKDTQKALQNIAADVSTQSRFGKLWHKNIMQNLQLFAHAQSGSCIDFNKTHFPTQKTAFVAAAGPSLESHFDILKEKRNAFYIIATDTAFSALSAQNIQADAVVTIDPQQVSINHFYTAIDKNTFFVCDLCCQPAVPRKILHAGSPLLFFASAHPLCTLVELWVQKFALQGVYNQNKKKSEVFPRFDCSSGTVTLTAFDFAVQAGFQHISAGGADFCYIDGKAYTKGSYFDALFGIQNNRLYSVEQQFSSLMYSRKLEPVDMGVSHKAFTTALLQQYRRRFEEFKAMHPHIMQQYTYDENHDKTVFSYMHTDERALLTDFFNWYAAELDDFFSDKNRSPTDKNIDKNILQRAVQISIFPYIAWYAGQHFENGDVKKITKEICNYQKNICTIRS